MIPYGRQNVDEDDIQAIVDTIKSGWITQGPKIREFEESLAEYCGAKYAVSVNSGTSALHLAYIAAGFKEGDEVITTPNTFAATSNMLLAVGAKPVFCDIRMDNYNIDESKIEELITPKTKGIVPVDFSGHPCELDTILNIAEKHNLIVIEDACHSLGGKYKGKQVGSIAEMNIFSFHPVKSITTAEGGAIVTDSEEYYNRMMSLRSHGITKNEEGTNVMTELGYNYRMNDILASLGVSQLKKLDGFVKKRNEIVEEYRELLGDISEIDLPETTDDAYSSWHLYMIRTSDPEERDGLRDFLRDKGIGVNFHYPAVYKHPYYQQIGYKDTKLPNMEVYHDSCITIPLHTHLTSEELNYISDSIKDYFNK